MPTAPTWLVPRELTKNVSVILYIAEINMIKILGPARLSTLFSTG
jgi:hypothetical protein